MRIEEVLRKLQECGCNATSADVKAHLEAAQIRLESLTDRDIPGLSDALSRGALAPKPVRSRKVKPLARTGDPAAVDRATELRTRQATGEFNAPASGLFDEVDALAGGIMEAVDNRVAATRQKVVTHIQSAPTRLAAGVMKDCQAFTPETDFFRELGRQIGATV